jgi:GT2 family glycosyltransferase
VSGTGVIVLGMHRSGTSAITRTINLLGVPTCAPGDLVRDRTGNPRGHWESGTLVRHNDELLRATGGAWWCPPPLETDWVAMAGDRLHAAGEAFERVHATPSWVWKDPRTCVTAPFWRAALPHRLTFLLVVRHPLAVAASLTIRNGLTTEAGIALWEGYVARAARGARGAPVLVCSYEGMLRNPRGWAEAAREFLVLQSIGIDSRGSPELAARSVEETLAHHGGADDAVRLTGEQSALLGTLTALVGPHERFEPDLPPVTAATERLFAERRRMLLAPEERAAREAGPPSGIQLLLPARRRPDELPPMSVVIAPRRRGPGLESTIEAVLATAPTSAEVIVVGEPEARADSRVTVLDRPAAGGRVAAIAAGLAYAGGDVVVLCDGGVAPNQGWPEVFAGALKRSDVGVVGPALLHPDCEAVYGLSLRDACLNVAWITAASTVDPFPVAVVPGAMMALRRETLEAVGGFDAGMTGSGGEDTELCIRLWRAGCVCLAVPRASAVVRSDQENEQPPDPVGFLHDRLRLGATHLAPPRLRRFLEPFRRSLGFAEAFARVLASDVGDRRVLVDAISCFDDAWLLQRFSVKALEDPTSDDPPNGRNHELVRS